MQEALERMLDKEALVGLDRAYQCTLHVNETRET